MAQFRKAEAFWTKFGARLLPEDLNHWPDGLVEDFIVILNTDAEVQNEKHDGKAAASTPERAAATQTAFDNLPRRKRGETGGM
ncbi:hypothetical protein E1809_09005 [Arthrobacter terricola]|uniref:Uncharacterized protein n=1 Tax=Arthrobacter terricola TaxID=2547396 RepID=A0A4R5KML5_9MICC|nr:hypothetical protein E1809_09005 [Arthrobacter terricola]